MSYTSYLLKITFLGLFLLAFSQLKSSDVTSEYLKNKPGSGTLDKTRWGKIRNDYKYKAPKIEPKQKEKTLPKFSFSFGSAAWFKFFAYLMLFAIIILIFYYIIKFGLFKDNKLNKSEVSYLINDAFEDINNLVIDPLLMDAIKNQNYKLATRLQFLAVLQLLNHRKLIHWKRDFTNQVYKQQLWNHKFFSHFNQVCLVYEKVWYGDYSISLSDYETLDHKFNHLKVSINSN
jgi:hypothetical protein